MAISSNVSQPTPLSISWEKSPSKLIGYLRFLGALFGMAPGRELD
jgi:hypothetical protein